MFSSELHLPGLSHVTQFHPMKRVLSVLTSVLVLIQTATAQTGRQQVVTKPTEETPEVNPSPLFPKYAKYMVVFGDEGSGAILRMNGNLFVVTNAHVVSGMPSPLAMTLLDGTAIPATRIGIAKGHDVAAIPQSVVTEGLEVMTGVDKHVAIGDEVVVLGNSQGANVVTEIKGKVLGIGADRIEIDAKFVDGNSGSPIIHVKTGKVIGVATYTTTMHLTEVRLDSQFTVVRRFGYRLDSIREWESPALATYLGKGLLLEKIEAHTRDLQHLLADIQDGVVLMRLHQDNANRLRKIVTDLVQTMERPGMAPQSYQDAKMKFYRAIVFETTQDVTPQKVPPGTFPDSYHSRRLAEILKDRQDLRKEAEKWLNATDTELKVTVSH